MTNQEEAPDPNYVWLVIAFGIFFAAATGYSILFDPVPWAHGAYFRETFILGAVLGLIFTALIGLFKLAGWFAIAAAIGTSYWLPQFHSGNVQIYFLIALYFNFYFSFWNRLTLLRLLGAFLWSTGLLGFAYLADPGATEDRSRVLLALTCLPLGLILTNGLKRLLVNAKNRATRGLNGDD